MCSACSRLGRLKALEVQVLDRLKRAVKWIDRLKLHAKIDRMKLLSEPSSRLDRLKVLEVQVLDRLKRAVKWIDRLKLHAKIDRLKLLSKPSSRLDRLKRWKLKLDRLQSLEVQVENSLTKF